MPDGRLTNDSVPTLVRALADCYTPPIARLGWPPRSAPTFIWQWDLSSHTATPSFWIPLALADSIEPVLDATWPRVARRPFDHEASPVDAAAVAGGTFRFLELPMFSFRTTRSMEWLQSMLELSRFFLPGETAQIQVHLRTVSATWSSDSETRWQEMRRSGVWPEKFEWSGVRVAQEVGYGVASVIVGLQSIIEEIITGNEPPPVSVRANHHNRVQTISRETPRKLHGPAMDVSIHAWVSAPTEARRETLWRALSASFRALDGDNQWQAKPITNPRRKEKWLQQLARHTTPVKWRADYCGVSETAALMSLPPVALQQEFHVPRQPLREEPPALLDRGIPLGIQTFKEKENPVHMPMDNWDESTLPHVVIGQMGTGKTMGFGGNWGAQAAAQGYSVISLDVEKDQLGDEIAYGAKHLGVPEEKIIRIRFGTNPIRVDWPEAAQAPRAANRVANEILNFFNLHDSGAGIETARYIRLAAKTIGHLGGSLADMKRLFEDETFRRTALLEIRRQDILDGWRAFDNLSAGMRGKVLEPVLNRFEMLLGDDYLYECMSAPKDTSLNFLDWMSGGYVVCLHLPQRDLSHEVVNMLADFLMAKIEIAMRARAEEEQRPCYLIMDEPHQFTSAANRWERMVVETRKWRVGLVWLFHDWDQLPRGLRTAIKSAGPHYHLYTSAKATYRDLAEELAPFTMEEALKTPRHWAINILKVQGATLSPFLANMAPPPSVQWPDTPGS